MSNHPSGLRRLYDIVSQWAETQPEAEAWRFGEESSTYEQLRSDVRALARAFLASGVRPGDRVAMLSTPRPEFWTSFLSATAIGAVWVGLNPAYQLPELQQIVTDSEPRLLLGLTRFGGRDYRDELRFLCESTSSIESYVLLGGEGETWTEFIGTSNQVSSEDLEIALERVSGDEPSLMVYTSGTTGSPKGALLSQAGLCERFAISASYVWPRPLKIVANLPINHVGGVGELGCMPLMAGGTLIFQERFDAGSVLTEIDKHQVTVVLQIPTMLKAICEHVAFGRTDWSTVEMIVWGGGAIQSATLGHLRGLGIRLKTMYGMTETAAAITYSDDDSIDEVLLNTVGRPIPGYSVAIDRSADAEGLDREGEVIVNNREVWLGYYRNDGATEAALTPSGLYRTGDIGAVRDDGNMVLSGRLKEQFKSGGYNVYPREVELALESYSGVRIAVVVGADDAHYGEVGVAYLELSEGFKISNEDLSAWCRRRLARYKVPKQFVVLDRLPLLPGGKVDRSRLKDMARNRHSES